MMRFSTLGLILLSVTLSALAQISLKIGVTAAFGRAGMVKGVVESALAVATNGHALIGLGLYGASMIVWMGVLAKVDVSQAYPFVGVGFVLTMVLGNQMLGESISLLRLLGTLMVVAGVACLAKG
jgi:multidrug transporter EmrE-like cation transporter